MQRVQQSNLCFQPSAFGAQLVNGPWPRIGQANGQRSFETRGVLAKCLDRSCNQRGHFCYSMPVLAGEQAPLRRLTGKRAASPGKEAGRTLFTIQLLRRGTIL